MLGATGTIGRATAHALIERGHEVVCLVRRRAGVGGRSAPDETARRLVGAELRFGDVTNPASIAEDAIRGEAFDVMVTCLASRTGAPADAWAIDYQANSDALKIAQAAGIGQVVLLSAICVQKPLLAFQNAKLAFETELIESGLIWSIVRPTAFFKSLSGQMERVRAGKPYLMFGDGQLTACKPISDGDLARFIARCLDEEDLQNRILPIGGPGPAITPKEQGEALFRILGREPAFKRVPARFLSTIAGGLGFLGRFSPRLAEKAELARIGHYYATQSMLVLDPASGEYDADLTPETGTETLFDFYRQLAEGTAHAERGDHAIF
ncbi:NAD(P)H-binding protein [Fulvimarina sp. MAC8]|uniref:NAD(P)H-binding protein n=1 Tax=Fulvimarina sp. MAC8 TaxID=3162874 RepID=UPI0032EF96CB